MSSNNKSPVQQDLPPNHDGHPSESTGSVYNSVRRSSIPAPTANPEGSFQPNTENPSPSMSKPITSDPVSQGGSSVQHRFLTPTEWARIAHGIGAIREGEEHQVVHPTCWYYPPKGLPDGLYKDVVKQRTKYSFAFGTLSVVHWHLMILQVMLGAVLTALGSTPKRESTPITALAAVNTVGAGLIALLHNSGLPDRYRMDKAQFVEVEDYIRELLDTGVVEAHMKVEDVLGECYTRFAAARATVISNKPDVYAGPKAKSDTTADPRPQQTPNTQPATQ
ncbi:uncharacterized protein C8A04DRAFT_37569 [Dichotomopilus funicola]|uniref:SMODS and SLOG-associating 2TM effector domain-containing protein n=1 Tax=Dichotomopilus funicola TaxID=1934379 RepID=A0AAN6ZLZ0_9PEZI|nr:hypothetical protein C8A04DRAFT_37569 [Dichotomopilus funicola]